MATFTELLLKCPVRILIHLAFMILSCNKIIPILQMIKPEAEEVKRCMKSLMVSKWQMSQAH